MQNVIGCSKVAHKDVHPHFQCITCGKEDCLSIEIVIPKIENRQILISQVLLQGKCDDCIMG